MSVIAKAYRLMTHKYGKSTNWTRLRIFIFASLIICIYLLFREEEIDHCSCIDSHGRSHQFCYTDPQNSSNRGIPFPCEYMSTLENLGLTSIDVDSTASEPVFVTAFSQSHVQEGRRLIASIRKFWKKAKIIVYDLGMSKRNVEKISSMCHVSYRKFIFEGYPSYFKDLYTFRWKPVIIAETLRDYGAFWYFDSSVIIAKSHLEHIYELTNCDRDREIDLNSTYRDQREASVLNKELPWDKVAWSADVKECTKSHYLLHSFTGHGIYAATDPAVYRYFPANLTELATNKAKMFEAGLVYIRKNEQVRDIVKWYVLCALTRDCMGTKLVPNVCSFDPSDRYSVFSNCHRYDQSVLNVLLAMSHNYDRHDYSSGVTDFFKIQRYIDKPVPPKLLRCS